MAINPRDDICSGPGTASGSQPATEHATKHATETAGGGCSGGSSTAEKSKASVEAAAYGAKCAIDDAGNGVQHTSHRTAQAVEEAFGVDTGVGIGAGGGSASSIKIGESRGCRQYRRRDGHCRTGDYCRADTLDYIHLCAPFS
jgi:hypothetical protein